MVTLVTIVAHGGAGTKLGAPPAPRLTSNGLAAIAVALSGPPMPLNNTHSGSPAYLKAVKSQCTGTEKGSRRSRKGSVAHEPQPGGVYFGTGRLGGELQHPRVVSERKVEKITQSAPSKASEASERWIYEAVALTIAVTTLPLTVGNSVCWNVEPVRSVAFATCSKTAMKGTERRREADRERQ